MPNLQELLGDFLLPEQQNFAAQTSIAGLSADSREIRAGYVFFAIDGLHADGHTYIESCLDAGAVAIVHEKPLSPGQIANARQHQALLIHVAQTRLALSVAAANWYGRPARDLIIVGVTGTDGKSSTVYFIHQILQMAGFPSGFFSTVAMQDDAAVIPNGLRQSTPEALELHGVLASMKKHGKQFAIIESTSHGLSHKTRRLADIPFQGAVFTNISHEHLEFHGSFEQYRHDKANLFRDLQPSHAQPSLRPFGVVNRGDPQSGFFEAACNYRVYSYASAITGLTLGSTTLFADQISGQADHCTFTLHYLPDQVANNGIALPGTPGTKNIRLPLPGTFNIENAMAALLTCACLLNRSPLDLADYLSGLTGVKGRMVPINAGQAFSVVVDYAHTPGAYAKVLPMFRTSTQGRLIAVFGSAGERDLEKRPMQGELAARFCNLIVLTNEDPRLEDEMAIIDAIKAGVMVVNDSLPVYCIPDRKSAIKKACELAQPGDLVILLGKGHEQSIIYPDGKHAWDEESTAYQVLAELGYSKPT